MSDDEVQIVDQDGNVVGTARLNDTESGQEDADDWPDDLVAPFEGHDPGECDECDWNRARFLALVDDEPDPGPYCPEQTP